MPAPQSADLLRVVRCVCVRCVISLLSLLCSVARATPPSTVGPPARSERTSEETRAGRDAAALLIGEAREDYNRARFRDAAKKLEQAYEHYPESVLLYNLGRTYEAAGMWAESERAYRRYLDQASDAPDRDAIREKIRVLANVQKRSSTTPKPTGSPSLLGPILVFGFGALGLGGGTVLGLSALDTRDRARSAASQQEAERGLRHARELGVYATAAYVVGAGATLAGIGYLWFQLRAPRGHAKVSLMPQGLWVTGSF